MDAMEAKMLEWRKKVPSKRQLTSTLGKIVQQKSVAVLYTPTEQDRIKRMSDLIAAATSEYERGEHWDRILAVVDALSNASNRNVLRESIRYLRLRLGDPSSRVVILALTLTEAVVKNCGHLVHLEIATEPFMHELEALHKTHSNKRGRDSLEIVERILDMVQAWGEAFLPYRHDYPLFIETYHNMRKRGVKFPAQYDDTKVPVLTPPTVSATIDTSSVSSSSSALAGLSATELYHVATNITEMFEDMLHEAQKPESSMVCAEGVILELALQARELVHRMERVIQSAAADGNEHLGEYLSVNDNLHAALKRYDALSAKQAAAALSNNQRDHDASRRSSDAKTNQTDTNDDDDDPFAEFVQQRVGSAHGATSASRKQSPPERSNQTDDASNDGVNDDDDDDPFASFVQQRAAKIFGSSSSGSGSGNGADDAIHETKPQPAVETNLIDLWDDEPVSVLSSSAVSSIAAAPAATDLWLEDDLLGAPAPSSAIPGSASPIAPVAAPAAPSPALIDDLWGDAFSSSSPAAAAQAAPPASAPTPSTTQRQSFDPFASFDAHAAPSTRAVDPFASFTAPPTASPAQTVDPFATFTPPAATSTPAAPSPALADPFDLLDFSHKSSIAASPSNPFDFVSVPAASAPAQQPQPQPTKSFNPFDF